MQRKFAVTSVIKVNSSHKPTFFLGITTLSLLSFAVVWVKISEKKPINFSSLRSCYHRLANRNKFILPLEKYFKTSNHMIIDGTAGTKLFESFTTFQSVWNNGVEIWVFDATRGISRYIELPLPLILQMK